MKAALPTVLIPSGHGVSLWRLFVVYFKVGLTGFGPALAAETKKYLVKKRHWISEEDFVNGFALAQLLPGATYVSLTVYVGYKIRGIAGALVSFFAFLIPPFSIMLLLSHIYFVYGALSQVNVLFQGLSVIVAGLVAHAVLEIGKSAVTDAKGVVIAAAAIGLMLTHPNIFLLLFLAALSGTALYYHKLRHAVMTIPGGMQPQATNGNTPFPIKQVMMLTAFLAIIAYFSSWQPILLKLGWVFFRMGAFLFGGGFSMIPFIQQEVVANYGWLTLDEFVVGIALGQVTPGPVLITATFVGYKVAATSGAIAATLGVFLPSLVLVTATAEVHHKLRHNVVVKAAIKGIVAAFTGMMVVVALELARHSLIDMPSALVALLVFAVLRLTKLDTIWVILGGAALYYIIHLLFAFM